MNLTLTTMGWKTCATATQAEAEEEQSYAGRRSPTLLQPLALTHRLDRNGR